MGNIFRDIKTAVKLTAEVRRAREAGKEASGHSIEAIQTNRLLPPLVKWINSAYAQGQQDAKEVAV